MVPQLIEANRREEARRARRREIGGYWLALAWGFGLTVGVWAVYGVAR